MRRPPTDLTDYWEMFLRRAWWIIVPAVLISFAMLVIGLRIPKVYRSETVILVDPQKVPEQLIRSTVSGGVTARLYAISQEILSRTRLLKIIDQFGLYKDLRAEGISQEELIEQMRKDITVDIDVDRPSRDRAVGAFRIAYAGKDPGLVQQVTSQLASLFIEENLKLREQQAEGTDEFIDAELEKARTNLAAYEGKMQELKTRYMGGLPEQQNTNLSMIGNYQQLLQANQEAISRAQQQKTYIESLLQAQARERASLGAAPSPLLGELEAKRGELAGLLEQYKESHPDVVKLRAQVKMLEGRVKAQNTSSGSVPTDANETQLRGQVQFLEQETKNRAQRQNELEQKIRSLQSRVEVVPRVEQAMQAIVREYNAAKDHYENLLQKKNASSLAAELERNAKGEQFRVLDPASYPEKPWKPDMLQWNVLGTLAGLLIGGAVGAVLEFRDRSVHSERDVTYYCSVPVIGSMPVIETGDTLASTARRKKLTLVACATTLFFMGSFLAVAIWRGWFIKGL